MISELSGFVQLNQKDYAAAAASFEATVKSGYVPAADLPQRNKVLSQLYFQTENYPKAIEYGNQYLASAPTDQAIGDLVARGLFPAEGLCERAQHGEESRRRIAQSRPSRSCR